MEPNNPVTPQANSAPQPQVTPVMPQPSAEGGNKKMIMWLIGGLMVIVLVVGGIYFYLSGQQKVSQSSQPAQSVSTNTSGGVDTVQAMESDLNSIQTDSSEDMSSVDSDLQGL